MHCNIKGSGEFVCYNSVWFYAMSCVKIQIFVVWSVN